VTCIVAFSAEGRTWMGGDSAGVAGYSLTQRSDEKVFANGGYLFGFTSSFRMGQLLRYRFTPPRRHPEDDLTKFMSTEFVDAVRETMKKYGFGRTTNGEETGGTFLVACGDQIFKIESDYQVAKSLHAFDACGCGEDIALGVMLALDESDIPPDVIVQRALKAAETFSAGVRGPFTILATDPAG
jgi:ATP-dependent protease HslVU (ClpYQ) peptidase subunit